MTDKSNNVLSLKIARDRRLYIDIANNDDAFLQSKASFALSGLTIDDEDAELAGRLIAGAITHEEAVQLIMLKHGLAAVPETDD
jgi:hypothetical protein